MLSIEETKLYEMRLQQLLSTICNVIDGLRSYTNVDNDIKKLYKKSTIQQDVDDDRQQLNSNEDDSCSLLTHLQSLGIIEQVQSIIKESIPTLQQQQEEEEEECSSRSNSDDERRIILYQIILPLLNSLLQIYTVLDKLPQSTSSLTSQTSSASTNDICKKSAKHKQNKHKPPIGMLSINDYTNIACLIEYSISITLVPLLEYGSIVYFPPLSIQQSKTKAAAMKHLQNKTTIISQKQCRELSKSLAGRISKYTIAWGTTYTFDYYNKLCDSLLLLPSNASRAEDNETQLRQQQHQIIYNIYTKYNELASLSTTLTNLLTLDRFKPMLLNKYISNIYAMVFCCERLNWYLYKLDHFAVTSSSLSISLTALFKEERDIERNNSIKSHTLYKILGVSPLIFPSSLIPRTTTQSKDEVTTVDNHEMALAYRTLLGGGASMVSTNSTTQQQQQQQQPAIIIPSWLKSRLGQCLTRLSMIDIVSVVDVFVAHANSSGGSRDEKGSADDVLTSAAMRLASALCAKPATSSTNTTATTSNSKQRRSNNDIYHERLCIQFINFLMKDGQSLICQLKKKKNDNDILQTCRSSMAMHLTLWAVLSQLSIDSIQTYFVGRLMSGLVLVPLTNNVDDADNTDQGFTSKQSVASIASWLLTIPSSIDPSTEKKVQSILLKPFSFSSDESKCSNKNENEFTLLNQWIRLAASLSSQDVVPSSKSNLIIEVDSKSDDNDDSNDTQAFARLVEMTIAQMIHILIIHRIKEDSHYAKDMNWLAIELLKSISTNTFDKDGYCFVVESKEEKSIVYSKRDTTQQNDDVMPNLLINGIETRATCLIRVIMSLSELSTDSLSESKLESENKNPVNLLLSNLFQIALLIHYSSMSGSSDCHEQQLLTIGSTSLDIKFIHDNQGDTTMAATVVLATLCETCPPTTLLLGSGKSDSSILDILGLIIKSASTHIERAAATNDGKSEEGNDSSSEELFSTTSIVLSLLIAMLELGADKRSESDESFFKSILPSLLVLCSGDGIPEVAEMASHAMALIAARGSGMSAEVSEPPSNTTTDKMSRVDRILKKLSQAEKELQSTQPPLRAKGVVSLRHIARSLVNDDGVGGEDDASLLNLVNENGNAKITEVQTTSGDPLTTMSAKEELGLISRSLARVCLNALADTESYVYLAAIQTLVAISDVCPSEIMPLMGEVIAKGNNSTISIADTVQYTSSITSVELSLSPEQRIKATESLIFMIRRRGEGIFMYGRSLLNVMLYGSSKDHANKDYQTAQLIQSQTHNYFIQNNNNEEKNSDERKIRLNTGGPVYSIEENALLRAGSISVTCELVTVLNPIIVASYCHDLVGLVISVLQLEESRPVRRAVACLARELYTCTLKEVTAELGNSKDSPATTMAIAIVKSNEVQMYNALISCVSSSNQGDTSSRLIDPATQSRCSEAMEIREELENIGILRVATLVAQSQENDSKNLTVVAVRKALA